MMTDDDRATVIMRDVAPHWRGAMMLEALWSEPLRAAPTPDDFARMISDCCAKRVIDRRRFERGERRKARTRTAYNSRQVYEILRERCASPEQVIDETESRRAVESQLATLTPRHREAMRLHLAGVSNRAIAAAMECALRTVARLHWEGRRRLRERLVA